MLNKYKTIKNPAEEEIIINKSRFIGYSCPTNTEEEAKNFIASIKQKHRDATHNCYAYIIGENMDTMRYSDDGEPTGTAGIPILETIKQIGLVNCTVVVTRYFGGILLGAGGLVRAYRQLADIVLKASEIIVMLQTVTITLKLDYSLWAKIENKIIDMDIIQKSISYTDKVSIDYYCKQENYDYISSEINILCDAKINIIKSEPYYHPWKTECRRGII